MRFFNLSESDLPKPIRSSFILNVEMDELFIQAGLQDRVIQVYEGLVYMDFDKKLFEVNGHGDYVPLNVSIYICRSHKLSTQNDLNMIV